MTFKKISPLFIISLILLLAASTAWAAAEDTTVSFSLTSMTVQAGENFTIYLMVDENSGKGFDVAEFMITFDNTYLEVLQADMNPDLSFMFVPNLAKNVEGNKQDIMIVFAGGRALTGTGGMAFLEFKLKDNAPLGTVLDINFMDNNKVALSTGGTVDFSVNGSKITVGSSTTQEDFPAFEGQAPQTPIPATTDPGADPADPTNPANPGNTENAANADPSAQADPEQTVGSIDGSDPADPTEPPPGQAVPISGEIGGKNYNAAIIWGIIGVLVVAAGVFLLAKNSKKQPNNNNKANSGQVNSESKE
ncbi:MAG: hypothetical protein LBB91_10865 [Clostridiales bacterium]|jgi:hypothetical protein|nr:hypothetical protein [Clostridiales bacterium]